MTQPSIHSPASELTYELMHVLMSDVVLDVELVSRELGLTGAMSERLRRAIDRAECAERVLQTMRFAACSGESDGALDAVKCAVEELAASWPRDYPDNAPEWLIVGDMGRARRGQERAGTGVAIVATT
ncbi:hypothetical protein PSAB6_450116 [Paraburkholderia sabiae]|nr:hypothetical protein PSAB6_450116 [Paraburkholderia sabiae]